MKTISRRAYRLLLIALIASFTVLVLAGCSSSQTSSSTDAADEQTTQTDATVEPTEVSVASLKGPTSIGLVSFMDEAAAGETTNTYDFQIAGTADEIVPSIISGDIDIALVPANVASVIYNKTQGAVSVLDINTLGVLYVVTGDSSITSFSDLAGHTVYMMGKGTTPEYVMNYLLQKSGMADSVTIEYKTEATEVAAVLSEDPNAIAILPQPYVTAVCAKNSAITAPVNLTDAWDEVSGGDGSQLVTGVTIVRNDFLAEHPDAVSEFMDRQAASVDAVNADPNGYAQDVVDAGIIDNATIAAKAIPQCSLVFISGDEMQQALSGYLSVLYDQDPSSVGGAVPPADFYYLPAPAQ